MAMNQVDTNYYNPYKALQQTGNSIYTQGAQSTGRAQVAAYATAAARASGAQAAETATAAAQTAQQTQGQNQQTQGYQLANYLGQRVNMLA